MYYKYYSQCVACLLIFLIMSFDEEKIFISMKFILSGFFFLLCLVHSVSCLGNIYLSLFSVVEGPKEPPSASVIH